LAGINSGRQISFWYEARSKKEMFYDEEFKEFVEKYPNFSYHMALSEPEAEDNWTGQTGFSNACLVDAYLSTHDIL